MKALVLRCPLLYYSAHGHGNYELIEITQELANVFHYMDNNANLHAQVKQLGQVAGGGNMKICLFKESGILFP